MPESQLQLITEYFKLKEITGCHLLQDTAQIMANFRVGTTK